MDGPEKEGGAAPGQESRPVEKRDAMFDQNRTNVKSQPWFPVGENDIRRISDSFDEPSVFRSALVAYVTLRRKANLRGSLTFEDRLTSMSQDMGMQYRDAQKAIRLLESIGLVAVERRKIPGTNANLPNVYSLTPLLREDTTSDQEGITSDHGDRPSWGLDAHSPRPHHSQEHSPKIHPYNLQEDSTRHSPDEQSRTDGREVVVEEDDRSGVDLIADVQRHLVEGMKP